MRHGLINIAACVDVLRRLENNEVTVNLGSGNNL